MTNQMPLEGFNDHDHPHEHSPNEAIQAGAQVWLAREFVGGLIAMAQASDTDVADFLADKCVILAVRTATAESEVQVLRTQLQALATQNTELQQKVDDCPCHDEDVTVDVGANTFDLSPSTPQTINGDGS